MNPNLLGIVSVEGLIGAGKSTILELLKRDSISHKDVDIIYLDEPVDIWTKLIKTIDIEEYSHLFPDDIEFTPLELFYENQEKYALSFQLYSLTTRMKILDDTVKSLETPTVIITERSCFSDKNVFAKLHMKSGNIDPMMTLVYDHIFSSLTEKYKSYFKYYVHIQVTPEISYSRICSRNRSGESNISLDYLRQLDEFHNKMYSSLTEKNTYDHINDTEVIYLDWNDSLNDQDKYYIKEQFQKIIDRLVKDSLFSLDL